MKTQCASRSHASIDWSKLAARIPAAHLATIRRVVRRPSISLTSTAAVRTQFFRIFEQDVAVDAWRALCDTRFEARARALPCPQQPAHGRRNRLPADRYQLVAICASTSSMPATSAVDKRPVVRIFGQNGHGSKSTPRKNWRRECCSLVPEKQTEG
jgi:hypothetical protein